MLYIIIAAVLYTLALMLGAFASRHANTNVVSALTNAVGAIIPMAAVALEWSRKPLHNEKIGLIAAIAGGAVIALFVMVLNKSFATEKVAVVTPIVFGGSIFLTAVLGYVIFKERITTYQSIGLAFLLVGIIFIIYAKATGK
jgi:drug/metabolite transporter (DMT)-like permease